MKLRYVTIITMLLSATLWAMPVRAQQLVDSFDDWRVFNVSKGGRTMCYIASLPVKKEGNYNKRSDPYLLVTHKTSTHDEVSVSSGYRYRDREDVRVLFGQKQFKLFTKEELAWAYDVASDKAFVREMIKGSNLVVKGVSWKGTKSSDTYSLKGFTAAHQRMKQICR